MAEIFHDPTAHCGVHAAYVLLQQCGGKGADGILFLSVGLIFINILVIELMQGILEKEETLRESALAGQKKESQLANYRDKQAVYERQGRKMHDYKNWIRTMQALLKKGDKQAPATLAERQTESISVEMAAASANHMVVDAVLSNVKAADRYGGDFAISCDGEKFRAVVML